MISISIPCLSSQASVVGGILHERVETRLTDLVAALESIEDGENGSRPRSPEQMRTTLVSMLLSDNDLARCITAISRTVDDGAHEDIDAPAIAAIVDAVRVLARHPEWDEFAEGLRKVRDVAGLNTADVERETNTRALLCDAQAELAALRGEVATLRRERDEARAQITTLRDGVRGVEIYATGKTIVQPTHQEFIDRNFVMDEIRAKCNALLRTTPTQGAQA